MHLHRGTWVRFPKNSEFFFEKNSEFFLKKISDFQKIRSFLKKKFLPANHHVVGAIYSREAERGFEGTEIPSCQFLTLW